MSHLYEPLIYLNSDLVKVKPVHLNEGERDFVCDLCEYHEQRKDIFKDKELYLLRNQSRGKGIGFFEAGNFYPDFIMWLLTKEQQYISFIDPKGLVFVEGKDDPKIQFHEDIKKLEFQLQNPNIILNSFIVSNTQYKDLNWWDEDEGDPKDHNIVFQSHNSDYINIIMDKIMSSKSVVLDSRS